MSGRVEAKLFIASVGRDPTYITQSDPVVLLKAILGRHPPWP
jgi:hypothetical protein